MKASNAFDVNVSGQEKPESANATGNESSGTAYRAVNANACFKRIAM
jgi:hypothetical protein